MKKHFSLTIVTTNCGQPVTQLSEEKHNSLFAELTACKTPEEAHRLLNGE